MRHFNNSIVVALATLLLLVSISSAQQTSTTAVPNLVRYSGTLKDAQGAALSSSTAVGVTFSIYKQQDGGAAVWMETQNVTPDSNGQYNVILGNTTATGLPDDLFLQQEQRWLGVQVQGEAEQARVLLVSVPYAFKAHEAETLGGLPLLAFVKAPPSGAAGIGSTGTDNGKFVNALSTAGKAGGKNAGGIATSGKAPCGAPTFTGAPSVIAVWDITGCNLTNSPLVNAAQGYQIGGSTVLTIFGNSNLFVGEGAGPVNTGRQNTFSGSNAGLNNATGNANTFTGAGAGWQHIDGDQNTFSGTSAGFNDYHGKANTFIGASAGQDNDGPGHVSGNLNTYVGVAAGILAVGSENTYSGYAAGWGGSITNLNTGNRNTFTGEYAGGNNTTGSENAFYGYLAGSRNKVGNFNVDVGAGAGGSGNTMTGSKNIFVGYQAGGAEADVSNNIEIGNTGPTYEVGNWTGCLAMPCSNQILIGTKGTQTDTYIQGIYGAAMPPLYPSKSVCVDSNGKLWGGHINDPHCDIIVSSRRFKEQIHDMDDSSSKLLQLRPVTFFYKPQYDDGSHSLQYGLIAEEVAHVDPTMVVYDKDGQPYSVKYQLLAPMLLNELQKQHTVVTAQQDELQTQLQQIKTQQHEIDGLKRQLQQQNASLQERLTKLESYVATQMKTASDNPPRTTPGANGGLQ
jgi:hypothetical protein